MKKNKVIILQRVCPNYRKEVFLNFQKKYINTLLLIGRDIPNSKVKNSNNLKGIRHKVLKTVHFNFFKRTLTVHLNLIFELIRYKPEIIICEAESHVIGYMTAICYKYFFNNNVQLGYWCFIGIPGRFYEEKSFKEVFKRNMRKFFSHFFIYHSYGKNLLVKSGINNDKITVVHNVGDTDRFRKYSKKTSSLKAKESLGLNDQITLLFLGSLEKNKKPEKLFDILNFLNEKANLIFLGNGPMLNKLNKLRNERGNILFPGHVNNDIELYLAASDIMIVPGRGGINISEALAYGIPVIVYQADGIEYDLIVNYRNGFIIDNDNTECFCNAIKSIMCQNFKFHDLLSFNSESMASSLAKGCDIMLA